MNSYEKVVRLGNFSHDCLAIPEFLKGSGNILTCPICEKVFKLPEDDEQEA